MTRLARSGSARQAPRAASAGAIALVIVASAAAAPVVARSVVDFARNAHRVDGFHAVGADTPRAKRSQKLVATNNKGVFPKSLLRNAKNSDRLGGLLPVFYEPTPCGADIAARGFVPATATTGSSVGTGFLHVMLTGNPRPTYECQKKALSVVHQGVGSYEISFKGLASCGFTPPSFQLQTLITPKDENHAPRIVSTRTTCGADNAMIEQIRTYDLAGRAIDTSFAFLVTGNFPIPPK